MHVGGVFPSQFSGLWRGFGTRLGVGAVLKLRAEGGIAADRAVIIELCISQGRAIVGTKVARPVRATRGQRHPPKVAECSFPLRYVVRCILHLLATEDLELRQVDVEWVSCHRHLGQKCDLPQFDRSHSWSFTDSIVWKI